MAAGKLFNLARMTVSSAPGTSSTIGLLAAVSGYNTFANAGVVNGDVVVYAINDGALSECGTAIYSSSGPSLTSRTPSDSTSGGSAITATSSAQIILLARAQDILSFAAAQTFTDAEQAIARNNLYAAQFDALSFNGMQINGSMDVSQLNGTNLVVSAAGVSASNVLDGWTQATTAAAVLNAQQVADAPAGLTYSFKNTVTTAESSLAAGSSCSVSQSIIGYRSARLALGTASARSFTVGFWVKAHRIGTYAVAFRNSAADRSYVASYTVLVADTWEYKTVTVAGDTSGTWIGATSGIGLRVSFTFACGSTFATSAGSWQAGNFIGVTGGTNGVAATTDTFQITGVVIVPGTEVPSSARSGLIMRPYDTELALCNPPAAPIDALAFNGMQGNGSMEVSQQNGTTAVTLTNAGASVFAADLFGCGYTHNAGTAVITAQNVTPPGSPSFQGAFQSCIQIKSTTALSSPAAADFAIISQRIEGYRAARLGFGASAAQSVTVGFWVYATIPGTLGVNLLNSAANRTIVRNVTINNAATWEYKTVSFAGDVSGTWLVTTGIGLNVSFTLASGSSFLGTENVWSSSLIFATASQTNFLASNNNVVCITGVVVLPGIQAPPSSRSPFIMRPFDTELVLSRRYFQWNGGTNNAAFKMFNSSNLVGALPFTPTMRAAPTVTIYNGTTANQVATIGGGTPTVSGSQSDYSMLGGITSAAAFTADAQFNVKADARL